MSGSAWIFAIGATSLGLYGLLNIIAPSLTIRWQRRSTKPSHGKGSELRSAVGGAFASMVGAEGPEPWDDPDVRRRVRYVGAVEVLIALGIGAARVVSSTA